MEFGEQLLGPYAAAFLADLGAEIIKVERPGTGETSRSSAVRGQDKPGALTPFFVSANRGKKSVTLDLLKPEAQEVIRRLAERCDVFVNNWRDGFINRIGCDEATLRRYNPRIIYANANAFGPRGPLAGKGGKDTLGQAMAGFMANNGFEDGPPLPAGTLIVDHTGGLMLASGIIAALLHRERTGEGQRVDGSLYGTMLAMQGWDITQYFLDRQHRPRLGRVPSLLAPSAWGPFKTADGWICLVGTVRDEWTRFCQVIGRSEWLEDPRWTLENRRKNGTELMRLLDEIFPTRTTKAWLKAFWDADLMIAPVQTYQDIMEDEQAAANGYVVQLEDPVRGPVKVVGFPLVFSRTPAGPQSYAPELGQNTEEVLLELGFSWEDIGRLRDREVI